MAARRVTWLALLCALVWVFGCRAGRSASAIATPSAAASQPNPDSPDPDDPPPADDHRADGLYAYTDPGELPRLIVVPRDGDEAKPEAGEQLLPLKHTDVDAEVRGHLAQVRVAQTFTNDRERPIEVTYTFPLPENAAVDDMRMIIGERVIQSEVQTRHQARQSYEQARSRGHTAALLEQERPNIFTQSVANVAPGETIAVEISYLQTLSQDAGTYEFVFPMVVGPRFIPGRGLGRRSGTGGAEDTNQVPDASRITPPILGEGERTGHDIALRLRVQAGAEIRRWRAPTHVVDGRPTKAGFSAELAAAKTIPNRDFVIRWQAAGKQARASLFLGPKDERGQGHFNLLIQPPALDVDELVGRREMIFVIDRSGSMSGAPLALAKQTLREALDRLRPVDTFDIVAFESGTARLFETPRPANQHNLGLAEQFIDGMVAGGGTMMAGAVDAALAPAIPADRHRYVFFMTDGYIGNEAEIFTGARALVRRAENQGRRARVFGVGIGSSTNRHLLDGLSEAGDAVPLYISSREQPGPAVDRWTRYVDHPVLDELRVDWGGLEVEGVYPSELPTLFASHAVIIQGRYRGEVDGKVEVQARDSARDQPLTLAVEVLDAGEDDRTLATLWAREKIADLEAATWDGDLGPVAAASEITAIGLEYHLVTAFTSLVAIDRSRVVGDGDPDAIVQPVEVPEGVDPEMAGSYSTLDGQAKALPVGSNTGRDFTAVVDLAPTASGDASGISLAGTTGAESRYSVDGANVMVQEMVVEAAPRMSASRSVTSLEGPTSWPREAKLRLGDMSLPEGSKRGKLRRAIRARDMKLEACYLQGGNQGSASVVFRLEFDAAGTLTKITLVDGTLGSADTDACVETVLHEVDWAKGLPKGETRVIEIELELGIKG